MLLYLILLLHFIAANGFKEWVAAVAPDYSIHGFIRNVSNGRVESQCEGPFKLSFLFRKLIRNGLYGGQIKAMSVCLGPIEKYKFEEEFSIKEERVIEADYTTSNTTTDASNSDESETPE